MRTLKLNKKNLHNGYLILVNHQHAFRSDLSVTQLTPFSNGDVLIEASTNKLLACLFSKLNVHDEILVISGYRSEEDQRVIYNNTLKEKGKTFTNKFVALPKHSEHHTGLAIDLALNQGEIDYLCPAFPDEGICADFKNLAKTYGFIERYPAGKQQLTKIAHEPWHFSYVGLPHSIIISEKAFVLEQYLDWLKNYDKEPFIYETENLQTEINYIEATQQTTTIEIADNIPVSISGNNSDGFIITKWYEKKWLTKNLIRD